MRLAAAQGDVVVHRGLGALGQDIVLLGQHMGGDAVQLFVLIIRKIDMMRDAAAEAGVGFEELVHPVGIACKDHHQIVAVVFHDLQQDLDGFLAIVTLIVGAVEVIGLVDEQHAPHGLFQHFLGLGRGVADILPHQIVAGHRHQMALADVAKPPRHLQRDGGLAGAGIAGEGHVQGGGVVGQPQRLAGAFDQQQRGGFAQALLDRLQPDHFVIEIVKQLLDARAFIFGPQVNRGGQGGRDVAVHRNLPVGSGAAPPGGRSGVQRTVSKL